MLVNKLNQVLNFRTQFNEYYDIIHRFTGFEGATCRRNSHIDYLSSSLASKDASDLAHPSVTLSNSSDEDPPMVVNEHFIGGGHGEPCCVNVIMVNHNKTLKDIGAVYTDDEGTEFVLVYIFNSDHLLFCSKNIGKDVGHYVFKRQITGKLTYSHNGENTADIIPIDNFSPHSGESYLPSANRLIERKVVCYSNGVPTTLVYNKAMECDYAEIIERYQIINPATAVQALVDRRPEGGYTYAPDLSYFGEPMIDRSYVYRIMPDGSMIVEFDIKKLMDVNFDRCMTVMYQEKIDVYGGGIFRCLPKLKPFTATEGLFDFSSPLPIRGIYPSRYNPTPNDWKNSDSPFDRIVDYFRDTDGKDRLGFACGYLPIFDGAPEIRKNQLDDSILIYVSRKAYPHFATGNLGDLKGVAYKRFFDCAQRSSVYEVVSNNKKFIYFDFFENNTLTYPTNGKVSLFEKENAEYEISDGVIKVTSDKGFATFIEEL